MKESELLTTKEAAAYLGYKTDMTIHKAVSKGLLIPVKKNLGKGAGIGGANLFSKEDLDRYKAHAEDHQKVRSFASNAGNKWTFDGRKTAIRMMQFCEKQGVDNLWEGVAILLEREEAK